MARAPRCSAKATVSAAVLCESRRVGYVLAVAGNQQVAPAGIPHVIRAGRIDTIVSTFPGWVRLSAGEGAKGWRGVAGCSKEDFTFPKDGPRDGS